jgi:DNA-binding response OmpR family regulator
MDPLSGLESEAALKVQALIHGHGPESEALAKALVAEGLTAYVCADRRDLERALDSTTGALVIVGGHPDLESAWDTLGFLAGREEPALFLSPTRTQRCIGKALAAGATDVLPPPHSPEAVAFRSRVVAGRDVPVGLRAGGRNELRAGQLSLDLTSGIARHDGILVELSRREFDLLASLAGAGGGVVSRGILIAEIWGTEPEDGAAVLDTTVHRLRRKLRRASTDVPPIRTIRGIGYLLDVGAG